jgi:hypothetical protein
MRFELPPDKRSITDEQLLDDLRNCERKISPLYLNEKIYDDLGLFSSKGIRGRFGSWTNAVQLAGLRKYKPASLPSEAFLADLRRIATELGATTVTRKEYNSIGRFSGASLSRRFGSWNQAIEAAGLRMSSLSKFGGSDEDYFEIIEAAWQKLGRPPKQAEIHRPEWPVGGKPIARHFGSWRRALEQFVEQADKTIGPSLAAEPPALVVPTQLPVAARERAMRPKPRTSRTIGWRLRFLVLRRDGFRCRLCGASPAITPGVQLQVDHIEPWANGGETVLENLQSTCDRCNGGKSALPLREGVETRDH